ncbi:MAG: hypothetical protein K0R00_3736 [Herbinix sp.]|nr:hypothetical protein [Herbinix sp.]
MMFRRKRGKAFILYSICTLMLFFTSSKDLVGAATTANSPEQTADEEDTVQAADVLLIYGSNPTEQELQSIEVIVKTITYLQRSIVFLPASQSIDILDNYENIICYNIRPDQKEIMRSLAKLEKNILFFGGDAVSDYIKDKAYDIEVTYADEVVVTLAYNYTELRSFSNINRLKNTSFLKGEFTYQSGIIEYENNTAALYSAFDNFWYTPVIDLTDEIMSASFAQEAAIWLWPYNGRPHSYSQYIVLNEVYPFYPPESLMEIVDFCINNRLSFIISVMPVYENGDYPAMKRFCEVLRYAQANGGAIILHAPNAVAEQDNTELLWDYLTYATEAYTNFGVYPLALQVPENYLFDETGREVLQRYTTVFCDRNYANSKFNLKDKFNTIYKDGHLLIAPDYTIGQEQNVQVETISTAAYINVSKDMEAIKDEIIAVTQANVVHKSLWDINHRVYAENLYYYSRNGELYFNDKKMSLAYTPFTYEKYEYDSGVFKWIAKDLSSLNKQLAFIVVISSIIFTLFIFAGRYRNRKRFLLPRQKGDKDGVD